MAESPEITEDMAEPSAEKSSFQYNDLVEIIQKEHEVTREYHQKQLQETYTSLEGHMKRHEDMLRAFLDHSASSVGRFTVAEKKALTPSGFAAEEIDIQREQVEIEIDLERKVAVHESEETVDIHSEPVEAAVSHGFSMEIDPAYQPVANALRNHMQAQADDDSDSSDNDEYNTNHQESHGTAAPSLLSTAGLKGVFSYAVHAVSPSDRTSFASVKSIRSQPTLESMAQKEASRESFRGHVASQISHQLSSSRRGRREAFQAGKPLAIKGWTPQRDKKDRRLVESRYFGIFSGAMILVNVVFVGYETDASMKDTLVGASDRMESTLFRAIHRVFDILFFFELALRICSTRSPSIFFLGPEYKFNALDTGLVIMSGVEQAVLATGVQTSGIVRQLRMLKVLRLARMLRFFGDLRMMVASVLQSCSSLTWALVLLGAIMYLFTIIFMQGLLIELKSADLETSPEVAQWFNSVSRTMLTLLQSITSGVDWDQVTQPMAWGYVCVFAFYVTFVVIGVLNVLTGIFVDRAQQLSGLDRDLVIQGEMKRERAFVEQMRDIFEEADSDGSGSITWDEFKEYLKNPEIRAYLSAQQLDANDARQLFDLLDNDGKLEIGLPDFIMGLSRLRGMAKSVDLLAVLTETREVGIRLRQFMASTEEKLTYIYSQGQNDRVPPGHNDKGIQKGKKGMKSSSSLRQSSCSTRATLALSESSTSFLSARPTLATLAPSESASSFQGVLPTLSIPGDERLSEQAIPEGDSATELGGSSMELTSDSTEPAAATEEDKEKGAEDFLKKCATEDLLS